MLPSQLFKPLLPLFSFWALALPNLAYSAQTATADLIDAKGAHVGHATFVQKKSGVKISIEASHLTPGKHGLHIHETGKCVGPDFKSAGGHFNPTHKEHGLENPQGSHAGDLPNLEVGQDGNAKAEFEVAELKISGGAQSLLKKGGTALVIHAGVDDQKTSPAGESGDRIACGPIKVAVKPWVKAKTQAR